MNLLASSDLHGFLGIYSWLAEQAARLRPDAVILAGDLLNAMPGEGPIVERQLENAELVLDELERIECPVLYLMGNDDLVELPARAGHVRPIHGVRHELGPLNVVGYQHSPPFVRHPLIQFEKPEEEIARDLDALEGLVDERTVLVTHSPAHGVLDVGIFDRPAGSPAIARLVERRQPLLHVHGHIHRAFGRQGRHLNVAAAFHRRAVLIDTETLAHEVLEDAGWETPR
jgi:Icc-related predicted phosphoesterase